MEQRFASSDGVEIVYDDFGQGPPVVLCHGLAAGALQLRADAQYFADRGFRVLVPDLRGHGRSGTPRPLDGTSMSLERLAGDLLAMLGHAGPGPVHWVGNSLGGILALQLLAEGHADRLRTLTTFGTAFRLDLPGGLAPLLPAVQGLLGRRLTGWLVAQATTGNRAARLVIRQLIEGFDPQVGLHLVRNLARYDLIAAGSAATLPMLMLRGSADRLVNAALGPTLAAMQGKANFRLVQLEGGGHCANLDVPDAWRRELETFWASTG